MFLSFVLPGIYVSEIVVHLQLPRISNSKLFQILFHRCISFFITSVPRKIPNEDHTLPWYTSSTALLWWPLTKRKHKSLGLPPFGNFFYNWEIPLVVATGIYSTTQQNPLLQFYHHGLPHDSVVESSPPLNHHPFDAPHSTHQLLYGRQLHTGSAGDVDLQQPAVLWVRKSERMLTISSSSSWSGVGGRRTSPTPCEQMSFVNPNTSKW